MEHSKNTENFGGSADLTGDRMVVEALASAATWMHVDDLRPWDRNPRRNDPAVPKVAESIRHFGFVAPVVVWVGGDRMVAGHTRLKAMQLLMRRHAGFAAKGAPGPGMVRVVFHDFETEEDANLYALADNRLNEIATWDDAEVLSILEGIDMEKARAVGAVAEVVPPTDMPDAPPPKPRAPLVAPVVLGAWEIMHGDALESLRSLPDNHFDALLSDPPYGLSFMGKAWDYDVPSVELWREVLRVLKPGAPIIAFSSTRTYHRMVVAIEDAGFEIRDQFAWMYGSGFPKSHDVSKALDEKVGAERSVVGTKTWTQGGGNALQMRAGEAREVVQQITVPATDAAVAWDGYGNAQKPAYEPAVLARKPIEGTVAENVLAHGVGGLAIDACRIGTDQMPKTESDGVIVSENRAMGGGNTGRLDAGYAVGRWPSNVILDEAAAAQLDAQTGERPSTLTGRADAGTAHANPSDVHSARNILGGTGGGGSVYADSGGASRFFYCAKPSRRERNAGLEDFALGKVPSKMVAANGTGDTRLDGRPATQAQNVHPTVKPVTLDVYLARLILPPPRDGSPRRLLVPYSGSGTEVMGGLLAGWDVVVGLEREATYVEIAKARIEHAIRHPDEYNADDGDEDDDEAA